MTTSAITLVVGSHKQKIAAIRRLIIRLLLQLLIPIPLPDALIDLIASLITALVVAGVMTGIVSILTISSFLFSPFVFPTSPQLIKEIESLKLSLPQTDFPKSNPLGGDMFSLTTITARFHDPLYLLLFGRLHTGLDMVPNNLYYQQSESYHNTNQVIIYTTHTGTATFYIDQYGSHTVVDTNPEGTLRTLYMHMDSVFVKTGDSLSNGTPIGTMGQTGFATGKHLHYEIQVKDSKGNWIPTDPSTFITN